MKPLLEAHPVACIFPMMVGKEFDDLVEDVTRNGVLEPVILHEGKILDGRNRYAAARKAGVDFKTIEWSGESGDPVSFVVSRNIHRRQMTPSQRSMCAAKARSVYDQMAKERQKAAGGNKKALQVTLPEAPGQSRDQAGKAFGVSGTLVDHARTVIEHGTPELAKAVEGGKISVTTAAVLAREPEDVQRSEIAKPSRRRTYTSIASPMKPASEPEPDSPNQPAGARGKGVELAHEAINCLIRIPRNDPLRKRGFQIVVDWIRSNSRGG